MCSGEKRTSETKTMPTRCPQKQLKIADMGFGQPAITYFETL